jgi:GTP cyclohydrolase I
MSIASVTSDIIEAIFGRTKDTLAERGARILIEQLGLNLADPNIVGTPTRLVKTLSELMRGQNKEAQFSIKECLSTAFPTHYKGMVILEPIKCISLCSHHLLPISYEVIFGYIPKDKSLGFSKIIKVINLLAAKPTLQEDFTQEIIDTFNNVLDPKGIMIIVKGKHECMIIRGEKSDNSNITSAIRGVFKDEEKTRKEFLSLVNLGNKSYM